MVTNPERATRGGDVEGTCKTDVGLGTGPATDVAEASYDPGYDISESLGFTSVADMKQGYCSYGVCIGDKRGPGYL